MSRARIQNFPSPSWCYDGSVNDALMKMIPFGCGSVLDVGCGTGANARAFRERGCTVWGITYSKEEAELALPFCKDVFLADLDLELPPEIPGGLDLIFMSHVLEHLRQPAITLQRLASRLRPGGYAAIAVPNMAYWPLRMKLLRGDWNRSDEGAFDKTHLQFWSFDTATEILLGSGLETIAHSCDAAQTPFPMRRFLPKAITGRIDSIQSTRFANVFGWQTLLLAQKTET